MKATKEYTHRFLIFLMRPYWIVCQCCCSGRICSGFAVVFFFSCSHCVRIPSSSSIREEKIVTYEENGVVALGRLKHKKKKRFFMRHWWSLFETNRSQHIWCIPINLINKKKHLRYSTVQKCTFISLKVYLKIAIRFSLQTNCFCSIFFALPSERWRHLYVNFFFFQFHNFCFLFLDYFISGTFSCLWKWSIWSIGNFMWLSLSVFFLCPYRVGPLIID